MAIVPIHLEQLDQYGTLEQLDAVINSLDDLDTTFIDFRNPNLEQLDNWGSLDTLPFSLDSASWETAFVRFGS